MHKSRRVAVIAAFAAVYILWGSTYLAIRYAVQTIPPFLMAGCRYVIAGNILYWISRWLGAPRPDARHWRESLVLGALLLLGGNGGVVWAEQRVPSGLTALMVSAEPLWVAVLDWVRPRGSRPDLKVAVGLLAGFSAVGLLVAGGKSAGGVDPWGAVALVIAPMSWAAGSLYGRHAKLPGSPLTAAGMQMLCGGALLVLAGLVTGEASNFHPQAVSLASFLGWGYLIVFGAVIGFTAYSWLLKQTTPARVSTYAYVNPVIAVIVGWAIGGETLGVRALVAGAAIISAVVLIGIHRPRRIIPRPAPETQPTQ